MRWAIRVWVQGIKINMMSAMAYRANFLLNTVISTVGNLGVLLITLIIYHSGAAYPGWRLYEALLLQGIFTMCMGLCTIFFRSLVWEVMYLIKDGSYDLVMIKPGPAILHSIAHAFNLEGLGVLLGGIVIFAFSLTKLPAPSPLQWGMFLFLFLLGIMVVLGCVLIMAATAFKWVGNSRISEIFHSVADFGNYPISIFPSAISALISFVIPVAMIGSMPAEALLGKLSPVMLLSALPCVLFLVFGCFFFNHMVKLYQSAGG